MIVQNTRRKGISVRIEFLREGETEFTSLEKKLAELFGEILSCLYDFHNDAVVSLMGQGVSQVSDVANLMMQAAKPGRKTSAEEEK